MKKAASRQASPDNITASVPSQTELPGAVRFKDDPRHELSAARAKVRDFRSRWHWRLDHALNLSPPRPSTTPISPRDHLSGCDDEEACLLRLHIKELD